MAFQRGVTISHQPDEKEIKAAMEETDPSYYLLYLDGFTAQDKSFRSTEVPWGHREGNLEITVGDVTRVFGFQTKCLETSEFLNPEKFRNQLLFIGTAKELAKAAFRARVIESYQQDRTILDNTAVVLNQVGNVVKTNAPQPYNLSGDALNLLAIGARITSILADDDLELEFRGRVPLGGVKAPPFPGTSANTNMFVIRRDLSQNSLRGEMEIRFRLYTLPKPARTGTTVAAIRVSLEDIHLPGTYFENPAHHPDFKQHPEIKKLYEAWDPNHTSHSLLKKFDAKIQLDNLELVAESSFGGGRSPITNEYKAYIGYKGNYFLTDIMGLQYVPLFDGVVDPYRPIPFSVSATYHKNYAKLKQVMEQLSGVQDVVTDVTKTVSHERKARIEQKIAKLNGLSAQVTTLTSPTPATTAPPADSAAATAQVSRRQKKLEKLQTQLTELQTPNPLSPYLPAVIGSAQPIRNIVSEFLPDTKSSFSIHHFLNPWELLNLPTDKLDEGAAVAEVKYHAPATVYLVFGDNTPQHLSKFPPEKSYYMKLKIEADTFKEDPTRLAKRLQKQVETVLDSLTNS